MRGLDTHTAPEVARDETLTALLPAPRLRELYVDALRMRLCLDEKIAMKLRGQHEIGGFFIGGMGEEVHGVATAQALWDALGLERGARPSDRLAIFAHYRSDALVDELLRLQGYDGFVKDQLRQQASRATDPNAYGRQMVMHVCMPEYCIQPNQSALGMQLGKAVGYAMGWRLKGRERGVLSFGVIGDGTTATSDFHESMSAAALYGLPVMIMVTDNHIAISMPPEEARPIVDLESYAAGFGMEFFDAGSKDFASIYRTVREAASYILETGRPALVHCPVTRFRGHSSSGLKDFDPEAFDPLVDFAAKLAAEGAVAPDEALRPRSPWPGNKTRYLANYEPNPLADRLHAEVRALREEVIAEPKPDPEDIWKWTQPAFPVVEEPPSDWEGERTQLTVAQAIRAALDRTLSEGRAAVWGEDVGHTLGGVFGCTKQLAERHPGRVFNTPINEELIVGMATGAAIHGDLVVFPEIQFADYSLNTLHWLVHLGHLFWASVGKVAPNVVLRMPSDPTLTGALYHSMSVESYYCHVPAIVICMPSNAFDAYGLLRAAAAYRGPVVFLEPKDLYRVRHDPKARGAERVLRAGPRLPGEVPPTDDDAVPHVDDFAVPLGVARHVRSGGDLTLVSFGKALHKAYAAARTLAETDGIECDVWDLRTLVPYDRDAIVASVQRTGRLVVATEDRPAMGYVNQIVRDVAEEVPGAVCRVVGMKEVPATGMAPALYEATIVTVARIAECARRTAQAPRTDTPLNLVENELAWLQYAPGWRCR